MWPVQEAVNETCNLRLVRVDLLSLTPGLRLSQLNLSATLSEQKLQKANLTMPLFNKKNSDGQEEEPGAQNRHPPQDEPEQAPPDEHTRLLPNRVDSSRGMLTPDDPAVSPYNLWSIRILRYLTLFFNFVSFVWWVLLLVSAFATPPGIHTRGSLFYAFSFATLTMANLAFVLLFFGVPSKSVRILSFVMSVSIWPSAMMKENAFAQQD